MGVLVQKTFEGIGKSAYVMDVLLNAPGVAMDIKQAGLIKGAIKNIPSLAFYAAMPGGKMIAAYTALTTGFELMIGNAELSAKAQGGMKNTGAGYAGSGVFNMSQAGYTMRQRAVQKMQATGMNLNSVLGNEARNYIKSSRANGSVI